MQIKVLYEAGIQIHNILVVDPDLLDKDPPANTKYQSVKFINTACNDRILD